MKMTKEDVRDALGLDELPDDEFMRLLEELGEGPHVTGTLPVNGKDWSVQDILDALREEEARDKGETYHWLRRNVLRPPEGVSEDDQLAWQDVSINLRNLAGDYSYQTTEEVRRLLLRHLDAFERAVQDYRTLLMGTQSFEGRTYNADEDEGYSL